MSATMMLPAGPDPELTLKLADLQGTHQSYVSHMAAGSCVAGVQHLHYVP